MLLQTLRLDVQEQPFGRVATLTFDDTDAPVNTMRLQWQDDLVTATEALRAQRESLRGLVLESAKSTFFAGADLKGVLRLRPEQAPQIYEQVQRMKRQFRTLETLGIPVVSCLNGSALGGGWEVALIGHHRIAVDDARVQFGLPEVTLGLIPGATGITKMTRLLGLMGAQPYIMESKLFNPRQGHELGLVHELVASDSDLRTRALAWIAANPQAQQLWDDKAYKIPGGTPANPKIAGAARRIFQCLNRPIGRDAGAGHARTETRST